MSQASLLNSATQGTMASPLAAVMRREPVACSPQTPIRAVLAAMREQRIGSMVITDAVGTPVGIFTLRDLVDRVALTGDMLDKPIAAVMTAGVFTMPPGATVYEAALAMLRHGIRHVLVTEAGKLVGVISEKDLFSLQRVSMRQLAGAIRDARDTEHLVGFSHEIREHARKMLGQGVAAEPLTQFIASLNDLLTQRVIDLEFSAMPADVGNYCWIALGSEGRYEQTFFTDQDNGIIFSGADAADATRNHLLPFAERVNHTLDRCGFPLCKGNIMAGNPRWCLSLEEWRQRFAAWIDTGEPQALLHGAIFFDFRMLHGTASLADDLRQWLMAHAAHTPRFLHQMVENALHNRPPLGIFRDFVTSKDEDQPDTIDLKLNGATLFADAARICSLAAGITHTNTCERLRRFGALRKLPPAEVGAWVDAFLFIQLLRLRQQNLEQLRGVPLSNRVNPQQLNLLERSTLKEALKQARSLQSRLALDYGL
jgi:CBS domain-containing protein